MRNDQKERILESKKNIMKLIELTEGNEYQKKS